MPAGGWDLRIPGAAVVSGNHDESKSGPADTARSAVFVVPQGEGSRDVLPLLDAHLNRRGLTRTQDASRARYRLELTVDSSSRTEQLYGAGVLLTRARVAVRAVESATGRVVVDWVSPAFGNAVQDGVVARALAVREAMQALSVRPDPLAQLGSQERRGDK